MHFIMVQKQYKTGFISTSEKKNQTTHIISLVIKIGSSRLLNYQLPKIFDCQLNLDMWPAWTKNLPYNSSNLWVFGNTAINTTAFSYVQFTFFISPWNAFRIASLSKLIEKLNSVLHFQIYRTNKLIFVQSRRGFGASCHFYISWTEAQQWETLNHKQWHFTSTSVYSA